MAITTWAATTGDWDDSKFDRGWNGPAISPAKGDLTLSGSAPSTKLGIHISPAVVNLELIQSYEWNQLTESWEAGIGSWESGPLPHVAITDPRNPANADLTLTGSSAPTVGIEYNFPVTVGELTTTLTAPSVGEALHITPGVASIEFIQSYEWDQMSAAWDETSYSWETGPSPSVAVGSGISPDNADITLSSSAPSLTFEFNIIPDNADITLTGTAPVDNLGKSFDVANADLEIVKTYSWDNYGGLWDNATTLWDDVAFAPTAIETGQNEPANADLTLTGTAPDVTLQQLWYIPTADLTLSSSANPSAGFGINVGAGSLTGLSSATWETYGGDWASASDTWGTGTVSPEVGITYIFPIDGDELVLTPYDPQWPLVKDPYYISQVIMS